MRYFIYGLIYLSIICIFSCPVLALNKNVLSNEDKQKINTLTTTIEILLDSENYSYASALAFDLIQRYPESPDGYFLLGKARQLSGNMDIALEAYNTCIKKDKKYYSANLNIGIIKFNQNKYKEAIKQYNKVIKNSICDKEKAISYLYRGLAYYNIGNVQKALEDYEQIPLVYPKYDSSYKYFYTRGLYKFDLGNIEGAKNDYAKAKEINPNIKCDFYTNNIKCFE